MFQDAVRVPMGSWAETRLKSLGKNDVVRFDSRVGSGFGKNIANWLDRSLAYPTNVLHLATETGNKNHSASFPLALPEWFIKLFTEEGDWVLDPFVGSGTTCEAAQRLGRNSVGIDVVPEYIALARVRLSPVKLTLFESGERYDANNGKGSSPNTSSQRLVSSIKPAPVACLN